MANNGAGIPKVYGLADRDALGSIALPEAVSRMADAGVRWIQIRAKRATDEELVVDLDVCCRVLDGSGAQIWINDRPDVARLFPVYGVHLGQDDLQPGAARGVIGPDKRIGRSTHNENQVLEAESDDAVDVVAIGPVYETKGKHDAEAEVGLAGLRRARLLTSKPLVAIGGIGDSNLGEVFEAGADSVAMLGAICRGDIGVNCRRLLALAEGAV